MFNHERHLRVVNCHSPGCVHAGGDSCERQSGSQQQLNRATTKHGLPIDVRARTIAETYSIAAVASSAMEKCTKIGCQLGMIWIML